MADSFRLGYVADPLPGHESYVGRLAIPYLTRGGVVSIRFRSIPENGEPGGRERGPRYLSVLGEYPRPYNVAALGGMESYIFICEGEIDTITATLAGLPAVGFAGAKQWHKRYWRLFRYRRVAILADNDDRQSDGTSASDLFIKTIIQSIPEAVPMRMPEGHDVNSFFCEAGAEALRKRVGLK